MREMRHYTGAVCGRVKEKKNGRGEQWRKEACGCAGSTP